MIRLDQITVSPNAVRQGRACGFFNDAEKRIRGIAALSTPFKHPAGNSSYGPFILHIRGHHVLSVTLLGPRLVDDRDVTQCKVCGGLMAAPVLTEFGGRGVTVHRPCPRAFDSTQPLCDTKGDIHD